jgi:uncharacterized protein
MASTEGNEKQFPENMVPLGKNTFNFSCHSGLSCYMTCCRNVDMYLFPYDIIRLKNRLRLNSEDFLRRHVAVVPGSNPYFPSVMMKLSNDQGKSCPFLSLSGCSVYKDRPSSCRTYPLERAVDRNPDGKQPHDFYFLTNHFYCQGHGEGREFTVKEWIRNQKIDDYNMMNDLWTEVESIFLKNPWRGEGRGGQKQQLAFMICYNIDQFRIFANSEKIFDRFRLPGNIKLHIGTEDSELLKFGFEWLKLLLTGKSNLIAK